MRLDLNCDLGEGEPLARTRALMRSIHSANVACGGHAGTIESMRACARLAKNEGVRLGAHPGPWSRGDFGRGTAVVQPDELELLLVQQVGALDLVARSEGVRLHHVKLHGALYHAVEADPALARRYLQSVQRWWPRCVIYARAGGQVQRIARASRSRVVVWGEAFADRGYREDGTLVPRSEPGAMVASLAEAVGRVQALAAGQPIRSVNGAPVRISARTVCVHGDGADAPKWTRALRAVLD
jgi:UPF0271 protein